MKASVRSKLITKGVSNLKQIGYIRCDQENIFTDTQLNALFLSMLKSSVGENKRYEADIKLLINECELKAKTKLKSRPDPIRLHLIEAGVKNLKSFGYPSCTKENIITDKIFRAFFLSMLKDNLGKEKKCDASINALIDECNKNE